MRCPRTGSAVAAGPNPARAARRAAAKSRCMSWGAEREPSVLRVGGVSYLRIPAEDPRRAAAFYEAVFGWSVRGDRSEPGFTDGSGHVIGHFVAGRPVAGRRCGRTSS
jgi:hypothetical protein